MKIVCWQTILMNYHSLKIQQLGKILQNLSSAAVVIDALKVNVIYFPMFYFIKTLQKVFTYISLTPSAYADCSQTVSLLKNSLKCFPPKHTCPGMLAMVRI